MASGDDHCFDLIRKYKIPASALQALRLALGDRAGPGRREGAAKENM